MQAEACARFRVGSAIDVIEESWRKLEAPQSGNALPPRTRNHLSHQNGTIAQCVLGPTQHIQEPSRGNECLRHWSTSTRPAVRRCDACHLKIVKHLPQRARIVKPGSSRLSSLRRFQSYRLLCMCSTTSPKPQLGAHKDQQKRYHPHAKYHCIQLHPPKPPFFFAHSLQEFHILAGGFHATQADIQSFNRSSQYTLVLRERELHFPLFLLQLSCHIHQRCCDVLVHPR